VSYNPPPGREAPEIRDSIDSTAEVSFRLGAAGPVAGFAAAEGWAAGTSVSALRIIGRPSLPEPMTTTFALGDCAS
jgi:hypothetical protein